MPANPQCESCGGLGTFWVSERGVDAVLCPSCVDRILPTLRLGGLRKAFTRPRRMDGRCPYCGWTQDRLIETSLVGCPICYEALDLHQIPGLT